MKLIARIFRRADWRDLPADWEPNLRTLPAEQRAEAARQLLKKALCPGGAA